MSSSPFRDDDRYQPTSHNPPTHNHAKQTGMASYFSSLASPGFHAGPSPTALAAAAAMAAAAVSGPYGGDGGSHHDGADDFFASPSPR